MRHEAAAPISQMPIEVLVDAKTRHPSKNVETPFEQAKESKGGQNHASRR